VKRRRDGEIDAFSADLDLARLGRSTFAPPAVGRDFQPRRRGKSDHRFRGFTD